MSSGLLHVASAAATAAGEVIRAAADGARSLTWEAKGASDFVTQVDRDAESRIRDVIHSNLPHATILGEELSPDDAPNARGITFIVDPLDGTTNFLHRYPQYAVSIGVLVDGSLAAGVVLNVVTGDLFSASLGEGAYLNAERIFVSSIDDPSRALVGTGFPFKRHDLLDEYSRQFGEVSRHTAGIRRAGSAALDLADVACGRFDAFWELDLAPWDIAAGVMLVREAGGIVTDVGGQFRDISQGSVVAGNPDIHHWLLETLSRVAQ
ncbi:MAG: inositol monophosphatase family protein [Gemmatimonadaceae bacterium]